MGCVRAFQCAERNLVVFHYAYCLEFDRGGEVHLLRRQSFEGEEQCSHVVEVCGSCFDEDAEPEEGGDGVVDDKTAGLLESREEKGKIGRYYLVAREEPVLELSEAISDGGVWCCSVFTYTFF